MTRKIAPITVLKRSPISSLAATPVVEDREDERTYPRALEAEETADDRDHEHVDASRRC